MQSREVNAPKGTQCKWLRLDLHILVHMTPNPWPWVNHQLPLVWKVTFGLCCFWFSHIEFISETCSKSRTSGWHVIHFLDHENVLYDLRTHQHSSYTIVSKDPKAAAKKKKTNSGKGRLGNTAPGSLVHIIKHTQLDRKSQDSVLDVRVSSSSANLSTPVLLSGKTFLGPCLPESVVIPTRNVILFHCPPTLHTEDD